MGIIRKTASLASFGAVGFRSEKDRSRRAYRKEARANTNLARVEAVARRRESRAIVKSLKDK